MTDLDALAIEPLAGPPSEWSETVRSLCVHVSDDAPSASAAASWLCDRGAASRAAAERQLRFLDDLGLLCVDEECRLDERGHQLLDADADTEPVVLYRALSSVRGFDAAVDALGVRPLTDIEILDLLGTELDADLEDTETDVVEPLLGWLVALGYLTRDGGLNELTRAGKRRSEGIDGFRERADTDGEANGTDTTSAVEASVDDGLPTAPGGESHRATDTAAVADADTAVDADTAADTDTDTDAGAVPDAGTDSASETPPETSLLDAYDYRCMVCGDRRRRASDEGYAEQHRPMPPAEGGPETAANAVVVCPNHRADLEHGLIRIDPQTLDIQHAYEDSVDGHRLTVADDHDLGAAYLAYHNDVVADIDR